MAGENNAKKTTKSQAPSTKRTTEVIENPYKKTKTGSTPKKTDGAAADRSKQTQAKPSQTKQSQTKQNQAKPSNNKAPRADNAQKAKKTKNNELDMEIESDVKEIYREMQSKPKKKGIVLTVFTCFFAVIASAVVIFFLVSLCDPIVYSDFYSSAEAVVTIPGTKEGFVPQGLAYSEDADVYLICGYMQDKSASRIYLVTPEGESKELRLLKENGDKYTGHAGGISCNGNNVYMSNNGKILYVSLTALLDAEDLQSVKFEGSFSVPCSASFTFCDDNMLYVGEFFHDGYDTDDSHIIPLDNGGSNQAFVFGYSLDEKGEFGVKDINKPEIIYSVRNKVQGFAVTEEGKIALSTSYGLADSYLYIYNPPAAAQTYYLDGEAIPLYILDDGCLTDTVKMPFMSEDLDVVNGDIIISFESYAPKYGGGMLPFSIKEVMKYSIDN